MKQKLFLIVFLVIAAAANVSAKGGIPIIYSNGEEIENAYILPYKNEYFIQADDGNWYHANVGVLHEQFSLFWIPLVNYGTEKYVLYTDTKVGEYDHVYVELSDDDIEYLQSEFADFSPTPKLPFWDAWGGKLLVLGIILFFFICAKTNI